MSNPRSNYVSKLLAVEDGTITASDLMFFNFLFQKQELIFLYTQMEVKAEEIYQRTGKRNEQLESNAKFLKVLSLTITKMRNINDEYSALLHEKDRQIEYLKSQLPHVSLKDTKVVYENGKIKMVKK